MLRAQDAKDLKELISYQVEQKRFPIAIAAVPSKAEKVVKIFEMVFVVLLGQGPDNKLILERL